MSSKKRKRDNTALGPQPVRDAVRKTWAKAMFNDAEFVGMCRHQVNMLIKGDQVNALNDTQKKHIKKAGQELEMAQRRLLAVARSMQRD